LKLVNISALSFLVITLSGGIKKTISKTEKVIDSKFVKEDRQEVTKSPTEVCLKVKLVKSNQRDSFGYEIRLDLLKFLLIWYSEN